MTTGSIGSLNVICTVVLRGQRPFGLSRQPPTGLGTIDSIFGGVKSSGTAREGGIEGVYEFSETKTVYIDYSGRLQKAQDIE